MKAPTFITYLVLLAGCESTSENQPEPYQSTENAWSHGHSLVFDGLTRTYSLYAPANGEARGLVVVLHGAGQSVDHLVSELEAEATAEENGLVVAVPAGVDYGWNDEDPPGDGLADDVGFIDALVEEIKAEYPGLPSSKVFAHGFSNGGGLATRLACESSQIRGVGVIGNYYMSITEDCLRPVEHPVPGWFGAGMDDELVRVESVRERMPDYAGDLTDCAGTGSLEAVEVDDLPSDVVCKQIPGCDAARLCEYDDRGHEMLPDSFSAAWRFLDEAVELIAD